MQYIRLSLRLTITMLFILFCLLLVLFIYPWCPKKLWPYFVQMWARGMVKSAGIKIKTDHEVNSYIQENTMIISNHISWIDIPIMYTMYSVGFVAAQELRSWPIIGLLIKSGSTIFIDRSLKRDLIKTNEILTSRLKAGATVGFFPEGKTSDGLRILPFKPALFEAGINAKSKIIPLMIEYYDHNGYPTNKPTFADKITLLQSVRQTLSQKKITAHLRRLPEINCEDFKNREELSNFLEKLYTAEYQKYLNLYIKQH